MFKNVMKNIEQVKKKACFKTKSCVLQQYSAFPTRVGKIKRHKCFINFVVQNVWHIYIKHVV